MADAVVPLLVGLGAVGLACLAHRSPSPDPAVGRAPVFDRLRMAVLAGAFGLLCLAVGVARLVT